MPPSNGSVVNVRMLITSPMVIGWLTSTSPPILVSIDASLTPLTYNDAASNVHKRKATFFVGFSDDGLAEDSEDDFDVDCRSSFATFPVFVVPREGDGEEFGQLEVVVSVTAGLESANESFGVGDGV